MRFSRCVGVLVVAVAGGCAHRPRVGEPAMAIDDDPIRASRATLRVDGIHCSLCAAGLEKALVSVPGVARASADAPSGAVWVEFQGSAHPSGNELSRAVSDAGYTLARIGR